MPGGGPPHPEYRSLNLPDMGGVALAAAVDPLRAILERGTLYAYAAAHEARRTLEGRGPAYAIPLGTARVVVRHVRHGGWLAPLTGDVFLAPTRAPYELAVSHRLRDGGVATPEVVAYVTYAAGPFLRRADVATREVPDAIDMGTLLVGAAQAGAARAGAARADAWAAAAALIESLARVGAYHADLNVKNVLIAAAADGALTAHALDVDRVVWGRPGDPALVRANTRRLHRSAHKRGLL